MTAWWPYTVQKSHQEMSQAQLYEYNVLGKQVGKQV